MHNIKRYLYILVILNFIFINAQAKHFLSFIMPCYNCASTVIESIDSIYKQNLSIPFELICTDDGSSDSTREILKQCEQTYPHMRVYFHEKNKGGAGARNTCVSHAQGDLIFCLDSDNVLAPDSIEKLITCLDQSGCEAATFEEVRYFSGNYNHSHSWFYKAQENKCDIFHVMATHITPGSSGNYLYTKKSYMRAHGYPEGSGATDTWRFAFRQLATGTKIAILPQSFYWHRMSGDSYWMRDQIAGKNNNNYFQSVKEYPELFTKETQQYIETWNPQSYDFFQDLLHNRFVLISSKALEHLFRAKCFEQDKMFNEASKEYQSAIDNGCNSADILKKKLNK